MHGVRRRHWAVIAAVVLVAAVLLGLALYRWMSPPQCYYDHTVWLRELSNETIPSEPLNLTSGDLADHPIIQRVVDAYWNPESYPPARSEGEFFLYPVPYQDNPELVRTNDYLGQRWDPRANPVIFTLGDGVVYTWEVGVSDPGYYGSCG